MPDDEKTKSELMEELNTLRSRIAQIEGHVDTEQSDRSSESDQMFKMAFHDAPDGMLLADAQTKRLLIGNDAICQMLGYTQQEIVKMEVMDLHPAEDLHDAMEQFARVARRETAITVNIPVVRKDGSVFLADITSSQIVLAGRTYLMGVFRDVTQRQKTLDAMKKNETLIQGILDNTGSIIVVRDLEGRYVLVNKATERLLCMTREEILGRTPYDIHPNDHAVKIMTDDKKVIESCKLLHIEDDMYVRGRTRTFFGTKFPLLNSAGEPYAVCTVAADITDREQTERALRRSEQKYRTLISNIPDVTWTTDAKGHTTFISPNVERVYGYTPQEIYDEGDRLWLERIHPDDLQLVQDSFDALFERDILFDVEYRIQRKDGQWIWLHDRSIATYERDGVRYADGIFSDITERKRIADELRKSEYKYRTLVEAAGDGIASVDENGVFLFINTIGAERLGRKPGDCIGKTMWDLFPKEIADRQMCSVRMTLDAGHGISVTELTELRGQPRWYHTTIEPLVLGDGKTRSVMVIARDVHELRQAEEELTRYREKMAQAERLASLGTLSATVAHELTQPLTVLSLSLANVLDDLKATCSADALTAKIENSLIEVSNLTRIIDRFRNFARKSSETTTGAVNLQTVADKILELLSAGGLRARVKLSAKGLGGLPFVRANERDMEQLFFALVQNSIQAADGARGRELVVGGAAKDRHVELRFTDTCGGIEPENVDCIFEPFFTTKPPGQGTGLGLCVVRQIVTRARGTVRVQSEFGKGTTFYVTLPIAGDQE